AQETDDEGKDESQDRGDQRDLERDRSPSEELRQHIERQKLMEIQNPSGLADLLGRLHAVRQFLLAVAILRDDLQQLARAQELGKLGVEGFLEIGVGLAQAEP